MNKVTQSYSLVTLLRTAIWFKLNCKSDSQTVADVRDIHDLNQKPKQTIKENICQDSHHTFFSQNSMW